MVNTADFLKLLCGILLVWSGVRVGARYGLPSWVGLALGLGALVVAGICYFGVLWLLDAMRKARRPRRSRDD
jgi:hypothetical protein